jgi:uncharacterized protein (TIGR00730 family)
MTVINTICVYCGSSQNVDEAYKVAAQDMGELVPAQGWTLVYGGAAVGLMGITARAAVAGGAPVIGVIPEDLQAREIRQEGLKELHVTKSMHERQMMMAKLSDAFVALPGGLGTLAEFFEILTWRQLRFHEKPIILVNINNYWDQLLDTIENAASSGFMRETDKGLFRVTDKVSNIPQILAEFGPHAEAVKTEKM